MAPGVDRFGSGGPYEEAVGYSRVVRAGAHVWVSGCTSVTADGVVAGPGDHYAQAKVALENIEKALAQAGAGLGDVVRTRMFVVGMERADDVSRAHGEAFGDVRPATAMIGVAALMDPRMLVEIEADAFVADATTA